jgi:hypothetical protein
LLIRNDKMPFLRRFWKVGDITELLEKVQKTVAEIRAILTVSSPSQYQRMTLDWIVVDERSWIPHGGARVSAPLNRGRLLLIF